MADGKPDFSGFWSLPYVPNMAATKEAEAAVPYTPEGLRAYRNHDAKDDPTSLCLYPGVPRIMQSPYPLQIVQTTDHLVMLFEYMGFGDRFRPTAAPIVKASSRRSWATPSVNGRATRW